MMIFYYLSRKQPIHTTKWQTCFWKLKLKSNKLVDLRNLYPNMIVFRHELLIFWGWFWKWTWKYRFPKFLTILFFPLTHTVHLLACSIEAARDDYNEISSFLASKSYQNINFDQIKTRDINLMITYLIFYQNCNFLATHEEAISWNDFLLSSVESSRCAGNWQTRFWKLKLKSNNWWIYEIFIWIWSCLHLNCLFFEADSEYELENIDFQNFWKYYFSPLTHTVHLLACGGEAAW